MPSFLTPIVGWILSGVSIIALLGSVVGLVEKSIALDKTEKQLATANNRISQLDADVSTLHENQTKLEAGLNQCNISVQQSADVANAVSQAGVKALQQVQQAGKSVDRKAKAIDAMPNKTCEDAFNILKSN